jgi:hypothetical protein
VQMDADLAENQRLHAEDFQLIGNIAPCMKQLGATQGGLDFRQQFFCQRLSMGKKTRSSKLSHSFLKTTGAVLTPYQLKSLDL